MPVAHKRLVTNERFKMHDNLLNRLVFILVALTVIGCSSPRDQFNSAIEEAIKSAKTADERQRLQKVKDVSAYLKDEELIQFVKGWEAQKKAEGK